MYRFVERAHARAGVGDRAAPLYRDAGTATPRSRSSTTCTTPAGMLPSAHLDAPRATTGIAITLLPSLYRWSSFGGARCSRASGASERPRPRCSRRRARASARDAGHHASACRRIRCARWTRPRSRSWRRQRAGRCADPHPRRRADAARSTSASAALGRRPVEWLLAKMRLDERWCVVHATHMPPEETEGARAQRRRGGAVPDHRGQPRRRHLPACSPIALPAGATASAATATSRATRPRSCACSSTCSACRARKRNLVVGGATPRSAPRCGWRRPPAALRRSGAGWARSRPGMRADLVVLDGEHPTWRGAAATRSPMRWCSPARAELGARRHGRRRVDAARAPAPQGRGGGGGLQAGDRRATRVARSDRSASKMRRR